GATSEAGITDEPTGCVPRHVEFRDDPDAAVGRICDNFANLFLRVVKPIRTHPLQLGKALAFDAESLIIGEMPVEDVHLHCSQPVDVTLDDVDRLPVARDVDHQASPCKARLVLDADELQEIATLIGGDELPNRLQTSDRT